jgi:hypothetical protein
MKKFYEAPSVEMTRFASEDTMTVFKSGVNGVATKSSLSDATFDLSEDF